jgi:hypothetical protein
VGAHGVVLEPDALAFSDPVPDQGVAQLQDALFAFPLKGALGNIASRPFFPKGDDPFPKPIYEIPPAPLY